MNPIAALGSWVETFYGTKSGEIRLGCGVVGAAVGGYIFSREASQNTAPSDGFTPFSPLAYKAAVVVGGSATGFVMGFAAPFVLPAIVASTLARK